MKKSYFLLMPLALLSVQAANAQQVSVSQTGIVTEDRLPRPEVKLGAVRVLTDVTYAQPAGYRPLRLDIYRAPNKQPQPLVVFVHGGSWTVGHKRATAHFADFPNVLADLARRGFIVASVEYRLSGEAPFPGAVDDVKAAVTFLRANAGLYGIDADQIAIWGGSAGAHLSAMTALTDPSVKAFVGWYGPYDIDAMMAGLVAGAKSGVQMSPEARRGPEGALSFFGCSFDGCPEGVAAKASPLSYVDSSDPPTLLVHGDIDTVAPLSQSEALAKALKTVGVPVELVVIPGANHDWTSATPDATTKSSRRAVQVTFDWLDNQFAAKRKKQTK